MIFHQKELLLQQTTITEHWFRLWDYINNNNRNAKCVCVCVIGNRQHCLSNLLTNKLCGFGLGSSSANQVTYWWMVDDLYLNIISNIWVLDIIGIWHEAWSLATWQTIPTFHHWKCDYIYFCRTSSSLKYTQIKTSIFMLFSWSRFNGHERREQIEETFWGLNK